MGWHCILFETTIKSSFLFGFSNSWHWDGKTKPLMHVYNLHLFGEKGIMAKEKVIPMDRCGSWKNVLKLSTGHLAYYCIHIMCKCWACACVKMFCTLNKNPKWFKIGFISLFPKNRHILMAYSFECGSLVKVSTE